MTVEIQQECLVVGAYSRRMLLQLEHHGEINARIKGKLLRPVCGDRVIAEPIANEPEWLISEILPRKNELTRPDKRGRKEVLAANLECVVVMAASEPKPDWFVVDRYLAAAELIGANAIVVLNKQDLKNKSAGATEVLADYANIGYPVLECSATSGAGIAALEKHLLNRVSILVGQSGVGKSSVINMLIDQDTQRTGVLSESTGEGRHTTVNSVMLELKAGGAVIDSPGVRDYAPTISSPRDVIQGFREIRELSQQCRFANCIHQREPGCAVKHALEEATLSARRYESYKRLLNTSGQLAEKFT